MRISHKSKGFPFYRASAWRKKSHKTLHRIFLRLSSVPPPLSPLFTPLPIFGKLVRYFAPKHRVTHQKRIKLNIINTKKRERLMEKKEMYVAPEVEIIEVSVERGFEASATDPGIGGGDLDLPF